MRTVGRILLVLIPMVAVLEGLLRLVPVPDPTQQIAGFENQSVHLYLPGWSFQSIRYGRTPPYSTTFITGPLHGVSTRQVEYSINQYGFPYAETRMSRKSPSELRIAVVGGSTVECSSLEEGKRWPAVLERLLGEAELGRPVTVLNLGMSAQGTPTHLATVAQHAVKLDLDYLVFMLGANDMFRVGKAGDPLLRDDAIVARAGNWVRSLVLNSNLLKLQLARRLHALYHRLKGTGFNDPDKPYYAHYVKELLSLPVLPTAKLGLMPDALRDYERNIISLAALATAHEITPVFITQPMLWKPVMTAEEEAVDWFRGTITSGGRRYRIPSAEQARALELLNQRLLDTCSRRGFKCGDAVKQVPRTLEFFYDTVHLNEAGAEAVAHHVADLVRSDRTQLTARVPSS